MDGETMRIRSELFGSAFVLVGHLGRRMDVLLHPMGLTARQWLLLAVLSRAGRALSLSEAAAGYGSSRQNIKQIALALAGRGYLRLEADPADARTVRLRLTERVGEFETPEAQTQGAALLADVFAGLDADELRALHRLMLRWLHSLTDAPVSPAQASRGEPS